MNARSDLSTCANPNCDSKFVRFGDGELFVMAVTDPKPWGLPTHVKQKVLWLCDGCCSKYYVRFDRRHHSAQIVHKPGAATVTHRVA
jgi:hypothetical protein